MVTTNRPVLDGFLPDSSPYNSEPHYEDTHLRIKVICTTCGAEHIGNADDVKQWQQEHRCARRAS